MAFKNSIEFLSSFFIWTWYFSRVNFCFHLFTYTFLSCFLDRNCFQVKMKYFWFWLFGSLELSLTLSLKTFGLTKWKQPHLPAKYMINRAATLVRILPDLVFLMHFSFAYARVASARASCSALSHLSRILIKLAQHLRVFSHSHMQCRKQITYGEYHCICSHKMISYKRLVR